MTTTAAHTTTCTFCDPYGTGRTCTAHAELVKLTDAAQAAADDFDAQAYTVARLSADLAAEKAELAKLAAARDAALEAARALSAQHDANQSEAATTAYLTAEFARRDDDATCDFCDDPTTSLVIGAFGGRHRACTDHTTNAFEAADSDIDPERDAWEAAQAARGPLAGAPETIPCSACGGFNGVDAPERTVIALGRVADAHRDATQTYKLACGHTAIS